MKKLLIILLVVIILATGLVSCKGTGDEITKVDYYITLNGTKIELSKDASPVLAALGTPLSDTYFADCGDLGATTKFEYNSLILEVREGDGKNYICYIEFKDDTCSTNDNITIESTMDEVIEAYGEPTRKNTSGEYETYSYVSGDKYLIIRMRNKLVVELIFEYKA